MSSQPSELPQPFRPTRRVIVRPPPNTLARFTEPPPPGFPYRMGYGFHMSSKYIKSSEFYAFPTERLSRPGLSADDKMIILDRAEDVAFFVLNNEAKKIWRSSMIDLTDDGAGPLLPERILVLMDNTNALHRVPSEEVVSRLKERFNLSDAKLGWYRIQSNS